MMKFLRCLRSMLCCYSKKQLNNGDREAENKKNQKLCGGSTYRPHLSSTPTVARIKIYTDAATDDSNSRSCFSVPRFIDLSEDDYIPQGSKERQEPQGLRQCRDLMHDLDSDGDFIHFQPFETAKG